MSWFFYNSSYDIDDPSTSGLTLLDNVVPAKGFTLSSSFTLVSPNPAWKPFSPADNHLLSSAQGPCAVGYKRLLFYVDDGLLKPLYWELGPGAHVQVHCAQWVFSTTLTPVDPSWEQILQGLWRRVRPQDEGYKLIFEGSIKNGCFEQISAEIKVGKSNGRVVFVPGPRPKARILSMYQSSTPRFVKDWAHKMGQTIELCHFDYQEYKAKYSKPDRPGDDPQYEPPRVSKLTLVVHGIGQKLSVPTEKRNFTFAVEKIRTRIQDELKLAGRDDETHLMLPIIWRHAFRVENMHITPESIRPPFMTEWRDRFNDFMYDVPYYMSSHKELMINAAVAECNRIFALFKRQHPYFGDTVDMIGHSLGSVIAADFLSIQDTVACESSLIKFNVDNFICCGSPLGFFLYLRTAQLVSRAKHPEQHRHQEFGCLAVQQIYNIVHPYDFVASLLSPTVRGGAKGLEVGVVPREYGHRSVSALDKLASKFIAPKQSQLYEPSEELLALNKNGQLDWVLPSTSRFEIVGALTAHTSYWINNDFARMLINLGVRSEFRAKASEIEGGSASEGGSAPESKEEPR